MLVPPNHSRDQAWCTRRLRRFVLRYIYWLHPSTTSIGYLRLIRMIRERVSLSGAWSDNARLTCNPSSANSLNFGAKPLVDTVIWRAPIVKSFIRVDHFQELNHVIIVIEWFPNSHDYDMADTVPRRTLLSKSTLHVHHLRYDFPSNKVTLFYDNSVTQRVQSDITSYFLSSHRWISRILVALVPFRLKAIC